MSKILEFKAYCFTSYQHAYGLTGKEAAALFARYDVWEYLKKGYDVLHTMSLDYLAGDIDSFIQKRKAG